MCTRGVFQLRKLSLFFCDFGGSSSGVRQALVSPTLKQFMEQNKHIQFNFILKRNHHPYVTGGYINGYLKDMPLRQYTKQQVFSTFHSLKNQLGRSPFKASGSRVYHPVKSVQGQWMPNMFNTYPKAQFQRVPKIPCFTYDTVQKQVVDRRFRKQKDQANILLQLNQVEARDRS